MDNNKDRKRDKPDYDNNDVEELKKLLKARDEQIKARDEQIEQEKALKNGTYYACFTKIWQKKAVGFSDFNKEDFRRSEVPSIQTRDGHVYCLTIKEAANQDNFVKDDGASARTSHNKTEVRTAFWPCDIFENDLVEEPVNSDDRETSTSAVAVNRDEILRHPVRGDFQAPEAEYQVLKDEEEEEEEEERNESNIRLIHGEIAHLVPASPLHASLYADVAKLVFGLTDTVAAEVVQKAIHGCAGKPKGAPKLGHRHHHTGLKHFIVNKLRLRNQATHFDGLHNSHPSVLIVPIRTVEDAREWKGEGYEAVVLIDSKSRLIKDKHAVVSAIRMQELGETATSLEIGRARRLLAETVKLLAKLLQDNVEADHSFFTDKHKKLLNEHYGALLVVDGSRRVSIPYHPDDNYEDKKVRKIRFVGQFDHGHPAPDPMLLAIKAAICWSTFHNERLLAGGAVEDDISERSAEAEEYFLHLRKEVQRSQPFPITSISIVNPP